MATLGAIDRFRASVLKDGVARPSKYEVRITPPENIKNVLEGSSLDIVSRNVGMACNSIVRPGRDLTAISVKQGQDLAREQVGAHTYEGTITATYATVDEVALLPVEFQYRRWQTIQIPGIE